MSRNLTARTWQAIAQQRTMDVFLLLLDIMIWDDVNKEYGCLHICNNTTDVVSAHSGSPVTYIAFPVAFALPADESVGISAGTLTVTNVTQELIGYVRTLKKPMLVTLSVINFEEPDVLVATFPEFTWRQITYDVTTIVGQISLENFVSEPYPGDYMLSSVLPGIFS